MIFNTSLSAQARKRLHAGELILDGFDNDEIAEILKCSISAVSRWRKKLNDNNDDPELMKTFCKHAYFAM